MIIKEVELERVCGITSRLPQNTLPEFAFAGKSNVGKSSLINALMNRKSLARVSGTPGKTQTINYYLVNGAFYYVDLPGYGYAKAGEAVKAQWGKMIEDYLHQSQALRAVFLLVDIRLAPSDNDRLMVRWITDHRFLPIIVATKADKIKKSQRQKQLAVIREGLNLPENAEILAFSALNKEGREAIWDRMDALLTDPGPSAEP
jgi:GTP-binding protein